MGSLFINAAKRAFKKLPKETQVAITNGSGFVALINEMIAESPAKIREALQAKFPDMDISKLETGLFDIAHALGLTS